MKLDDYITKVAKLDEYLRNLERFADKQSHPNGMLEKVQAIRDKYMVAIEQMRTELAPKGARLEKTVASLKKNCSNAIQTYVGAGRFWKIKTRQTVDMFYAKTPNNPHTPVTEFVDKLLVKEYKAKAILSNSVRLHRSLSSYEWHDDGSKANIYSVFPINGSDYTQLDAEFLNSAASGINSLFDRRKIEQLFRALEGEGEAQFREFKNRANISYGSVYDVQYHGGLFDENWEHHCDVIRQMVQEKQFHEALLDAIKIDNFLTKDALDRRYTIATGAPSGYLTDVLLKGAYFAIDQKYDNYLFKALEIRKDYF